MNYKNQLEMRLFTRTKLRVGISQVQFGTRAKRFDECLLELPQILDWLALATANGMPIYEAIWQVSQISEGKMAAALREMCTELEFGESMQGAIENLRRKTYSASLQEFCNRLELTLRRGTPVADQLRALANSSRAALRNQLLAKAGANEIKLLLPLVFVILPVTVWFAVFPSLQLIQLGL